MHKTEFDPDTEMIDPEYSHEDMIVDDEGPDGPVVRDEYEVVEPLETEPDVKSVKVNDWGVHYDVEDHELPPKVGTEKFETDWGTETVTTSIVGDDGSVITKAAPAKQVKKPAKPAPVKITKKHMAEKSAEVVAAAKKTVAAVKKLKEQKKEKDKAQHKPSKTLHAKVVKKIVRKRGVAKGPEHIKAAKAAIHDRFRVVKAKKKDADKKKKESEKKVKEEKKKIDKLASHKKSFLHLMKTGSDLKKK